MHSHGSGPSGSRVYLDHNATSPLRPVARAAIEAAGLELEEERIRGRWSTFVGTRPS